MHSALFDVPAESATGAASTALAVFAGITRLMALPQADEILKRFVPWLASEPKN
ncbi:hypothetical protein SAMN04489740_0208 [Arthrobacter alpinus]|uniref:Uncharacterized protein n=1 Tax=Arthrobacter alpinus TaxID=656366 RepID=A0A1H5ECJ5_9MICC|nr:hypothetical protein [Arthrobacter alpinus]SED88766.1 hypothetical protein SAMN04489740_0208 [Arthrobacter alpinus]